VKPAENQRFKTLLIFSKAGGTMSVSEARNTGHFFKASGTEFKRKTALQNLRAIKK